MIFRYSTYLLLVIFLGLNSCTDRSESIPIEKAEQLSQQAANELRTGNYKNAERLLLGSIELYNAVKNDAKLTEQYASLAFVQTASGKLSDALQSLTALRSLYKQNGDRSAELSAMLEIARLDLLLGKSAEAIGMLEETYLSSQLFQMKREFALSSTQLGTAYADLGRHTKATQYLSQGVALFLQLGDTTNAVTAMISAMSSLLQRNNRPAALQYLALCERSLQSVQFDEASHLYSLCGFALLKVEEWELASALFKKSLLLRRNIHSPSAFLPHMGLGELFYKNYSFSDAQQSFVSAYKSAKEQAPALVQAYLLIRIADCEIKKNALVYIQERAIRASQLYEHAQTLCARSGYGFGEAVVLQRLGAMKELSGDSYSAVTYYKRAFDKINSAGSNPPLIHPQIDFRELLQSRMHNSIEHEITAPLISLLLDQRKYADALEFIERTEMLQLRHLAFENTLRFSDPKKQRLFADANTALINVDELQRSLFYAVKANDNDHAIRLRQKLLTARNTLTTANEALIQSYPELTFLHTTRTVAELKDAFLPGPVTALRYYFLGNEAWVFVIRKNQEIIALKLSSFGLSLKKKMKRFISLLSTSGSSEFERAQLSNELYALLIQPVERFGAQRLLIIQSEEFAKFPFHALTKYGRPLIETNEVSYLPSFSFLAKKRNPPQFITNIVAAGFSSDARWGVDFQLRDVRSFFKNAQIFVNQNATIANVQSTKGEFLHIASLFTASPDNEQSFIFSDGTPTVLGTSIPITQFTTLAPFPFVYLADINAKSNSMTQHHTLLWLMNGAQSIVINQFPITPKLNRAFNEELYSTYSSTFSPYSSYRQAMLTLNSQKEFSEGIASYFYYGL